MGRNRNKKRKDGHKKEEIDFDPPKAQSSLIESTSFTESKKNSVIRPERKNTKEIFSEESEFSVSDFEEEVHKRKVKFTIKEWLLLGMSRIVPHSDKSIYISIKENEIYGPKDKVEKFCNHAENEIEQMTMKILKFKYEISSEEVQFEMEPEWRCQIFSGKLLKNVAEKIQQKYDIKSEMRSEIESILNKDGINSLTRFLWVKGDAYDEAYQILLNIHKKCAMKAEKNENSIVSILEEMSTEEQSFKTNNKNSSNNSNPRASEKESESNSSADYSTIINSKMKSKLEESSRNFGKEEMKKYESTKEKEVNEKHKEKRKKEELRYLQTKSSMKNLNQDFYNNDFTIIESKDQSSVYDERRFFNEYKEEGSYRRCEGQDERRPRRYDDEDRQRLSRRGQREGEERNSRRYSRYNFDDSDYNEQNDNETSRREIQRGNRESRRKIIFAQEYPKQYFSKDHFNNWRRNNNILRHTEKYVLEINEKFSPEESTTYVEVTFEGEDPKGDIIYAIDLYFKFEKLIRIEQEPEIRNKMIDKFQCKHNWLTVEYKKIYTWKKSPNYEELKKLAKKDNTAQSMNKNTYVTHAFLMTGLWTEVRNIEVEINEFIKDVENTCRKVDIELKFPEINEFMRRKEVHNLIEEAVTEEISRFPERYNLQKITPTLTQVFVEIDIFGLQDKDVAKAKTELTERLVGLIDHFEFESDKYKKCKKAFTSVLEKFIIFENSKDGLTLIAKRKNIKDQMVLLQKEIEKNFENKIKEFPVKQKSELTFCKDFLSKELREPEFSSINTRYEEIETPKIVLIGPSYAIDSLILKLEEYYETIEARLAEYNISLTEEELEIIEKDKQIKKKIEEDFKITLKFKYDYKIGAVLVIEPCPENGVKKPKKFLFFENEFNFQNLPKKSVFFFRNDKEINSIKQAFILPLKNQIRSEPKSPQLVYFEDKVKECFFIYGYEAQPELILSSLKDATSNDVVRIFMYIPEPYKSTNDYIKQMISNLCKNKDILSKEIKIIFICRKTVDMKNMLSYKEGKATYASKTKRNWYTLEQKAKLYYSDLGNQKIEEAFINNVSEIELSNEDLNLTNKSHKLHFQNKSMTHIQSGKSFPIKVSSNKITFTLNGEEKEIPNTEFKKIPKHSRFWIGEEFLDCDLSIGFYKIDMRKLIQTNLFSNFQRKMGYDEVEVEKSQNFELEVSYDVKSAKLGLEYSVENENLVQKGETFIKEFLKTKLITKTRPFENEFTLDLIENFSKEAEEHNVSIEIAQNKKSFILKAYNDKNIETFFRVLSHLAKTSKTEVEYPPEWEPQTEDIQTFIVPPNSQEFNKVQTAFTAGRITELVRIQNKIVFRKFCQEKIYLKELNNGNDVKQMFLYHGTRQTDPKLIYEDKEECFNINYTGERNLLGKGIYFAERSEYSVGYSHVENQMSRIFSMFYCCVLVGESEKCPGHKGDIRDTNFKDKSKGLRYESMTDFLQGSNVYVVYKNRRAYPSYLIKYQR